MRTILVGIALFFPLLTHASPRPEREYEITRGATPSGLEASNRAHDLRARFTSAGLRVFPRSGDHSSWELELSWIGYGRGAESWEIPGPELLLTGARVDYRRGELEEWYENSPRGLEQGFTLPSPPEAIAKRAGAARHPSWAGKLGRNSSADVERLIHVDLALRGTLSPRFSEDGRSIDFLAADGPPVLRYTDLRATDARGRDLPAWMEGFLGAGRRGIRLVLDAHDAVYPITIDPVTTSPVWTVESDQAGARLGHSVATAGDVNGDGYSDVLVGAPFFDSSFTDEGRVTLYLGSPSGLASTPAWTRYGGQAGLRFGTNVATAGDVNGDGFSDVLVTASDTTRLYLGSASGLATVVSWTGGIGAPANGDLTAATAGDVNGDGYADVVCALDYGVAGLYLGSASGLSTGVAWSYPFTCLNRPIVATAGDVNGDGYADVLVGAPVDYGPGQYGKFHLFLGSASGLGANAAFTATGGSYSEFGESVATAGDMNGDGYSDVLVGQPIGAFGTPADTHLYLGSATGLTGGASLDSLGSGFSVAPAGDVNGDGVADALVGQPTGGTTAGRVYIHWGTGGSTPPVSQFFDQHLPGDQLGAQLGYSVATAGDVNGDGYSDVILGAPYYNNGETDEGRVFVHLGFPERVAYGDGPNEGNETDANLGLSVAGAGDVNGDGFADVIAGGFEAWGYNDSKVFVYHGSASGLATAASWTASIGEYGASFGASVAGAGDVNGDGYSDVLVGAPYYSFELGGAFVYQGSAAGLGSSAAWSTAGSIGDGRFGTSVASAGDVNGDGYDDVIVGAPSWLSSDYGHAFVYLGSSSGLSSTAAWSMTGDRAGDSFGYSVSSAGDVNGDGYADVLVGAPDFTSAQGYVTLYLGSATGLATHLSTLLESDQSYSTFGQVVSTAGDVNGDGYSDVIVTEWMASAYQGQASLYLGSLTGLTRVWTSGGQPAWYGLTAAAAGDLDGDGYADLLLGAPFGNPVSPPDGVVFLYFGSASGLSSAYDEGSAGTAAATGYSVAGAGDINGDGLADIVVGSPFYSNGQSSEGGVSDAYGNTYTKGLSLNARQRRSDDSAPIARAGFADPGGLAIHVNGRTPFGSGKVKLQVEVRPHGSPFSGTPTDWTSQWVDTGVNGASLELIPGNLLDSERYRWRARLLYNSVTTPFQGSSRWFTIPWDSREETMLRTPQSAGDVPGSGGSGMHAGKPPGLSASSMTLTWGASCTATDSDFEVYQGTLGNFTSHVPIACNTGGATTWTFAMPAGNAYFLIVPRNGSREGSYGVKSNGAEIPPSASACLPQQIASCP